MVVLVSALVVLAGSYALSSQSLTSHLVRVIGVVSPITAAILIAIAPYRDRPRVLVRGIAVFVGLGLAVSAWWFIPTRQGLNLFTATQRATSLREQFQALPADAIGEAVKLIAAGSPIADDFPGKAHIWQPAFQSWQSRSSKHVLQVLDGIAIGNLSEYERSSWKRARLMEACPKTVSAISSAEAKWLNETSAAAVRDVAELASSDPQPAAKRLLAFNSQLARITVPESAKEDLRQAKREMLQTTLNAYRARTIDLVASHDFEATAPLAEAAYNQLYRAAYETGLTVELTGYRDSCQYLAKLQKMPLDGP